MMMTGQRAPITPWAKGPMSAEQAEIYRKAIAPVQESLAAAKTARQQAFKWLREKLSHKQN